MQKIWVNIDDLQEHRRLYATQAQDGQLELFLDRNLVFELTFPFVETQPELRPNEISSIVKSSKLLGLYFVYTQRGGCWGAHLLQRGYYPSEKKHIPPGIDESDTTTSGTTRIAGKPKKPRFEITQKEAAGICGVTTRTIKLWETGKHRPSDYPGRYSLITLKSWAMTRTSQTRLKSAIRNVQRCGDIDRLPHRYMDH